MLASACTHLMPDSIICGFVEQQAVQQNPQQVYNKSKAVQQVRNIPTKFYSLYNKYKANLQLIEQVEFGLVAVAAASAWTSPN